MNILFHFVSLSHMDNEESLFNSLIHEFKSHGHNVFVTTKGKTNKTCLIEENGISVLRIGGPAFTAISNNFKKAFAYQHYVVKQRYYVKNYWGSEKIDLIISHSLPPELGFIIKGLKKHFKCPFYLLQTDFTWQDAVAYGMFSKNGLIGLYYRYWEKNMMRQADYIGCPTEGNISFIREEYPWLAKERFSIVRFWQKEIAVEKNETIREQMGIKDKFVAIYGGSVGKAQRIEHIINLAMACRDLKDIVFLILGRGAYLDQIKKMTNDAKLTNVIFKEFLPQKEYLQLLASCDVGFIVLNEKHATPNFPSKTLSYFNLKVPVLAAIDKVTDFGAYLDENEVGLWSIAGDTDAFKENLLKYYHSPDFRKRISENAYKLYKETMQPVNAYESIMKKVEELV